MTIVEAIKKVMIEESNSLTSEEIYDKIIERELYKFNSNSPIHVVDTAIRRHCKDLDFISSKQIKYFQIANKNNGDAKYILVLNNETTNDNMNIELLNQAFYTYLKDKRESNKKLFYIYRKGNYGGSLDLGHWFYGNESSLVISFWNGMDWKNKVPNIRIRFTLNGTVDFEASKSDSDSKNNFIDTQLKNQFNLIEKNGVYSHELASNCDLKHMFHILDDFIESKKTTIDNLIDTYVFNDFNDSNTLNFIDSKEFQSRERKIKRYQKKIDEDFNEIKMNYYKPHKLRSLMIKDYGPIKRVSIENIDINNQWVFVTGENGSGKTSLLRALATALGYKTIEKKQLVNNPDIQIDIQLYSTSTIMEEFQRKLNMDTSHRRPKVMGLCMYGPFRLMNSRKLSRNKFKTLFQKAGTFQSLFSEAAPLLDLEQQIAVWKANNDPLIDKRSYFLRSILTNIVPGLYDIRLDSNGVNHTKYITRNKDSEDEVGVSWDELSSGTKNVFSLIVDIMLRLYEQQPKVVDPAELKGIVIIDEIDLHLHPKAQKELIINLSNVFREVQFIVTTHSPIPLLGAPENSQIYVMKNINNETVLDRMDEKVFFNRISPNALLTSPIFDFEDLVPISKNKNDIPYFEENYSDVKFIEILDSKIQEFFTDERKNELLNLFKEED